MREALVLAAVTATVAAFPACIETFDPRAAAWKIMEDYGVAVEYRVEPGFLPDQYVRAPINARADEIEWRRFADLVRMLPTWLDKYPQPVLEENLRAVRLCGRLEVRGKRVAGMSYDDVIYIAHSLPRSRVAAISLESTFHHELMHQLLARHRFPFEEWMDAVPDDFSYLHGWLDFLESEHRVLLWKNPSVFPEGLVKSYGRAAPNEDIATYADVVFAEPALMRTLVQRHPAIRAKYLVFKSYFLELSPEFAAWFEPIG